MNNLSLTKSELETMLKAFGFVSIGIFVLYGGYNFDVIQRDGLSALWRYASTALFIAGLLLTYFTTRGWKVKWIARMMGRPVLHGIWSGTLTSDYVTDGQSATKIPIVFVIRQTYLTLSLQSFTERQEGESKLEALIHNAKTDARRLTYLFELRRPYVPGSKLTSGAGDLKLQNSNMVLKGLYWTDSPTHGNITLHRVSTEVAGVESFDDALRKFPQIGLMSPSNSQRRAMGLTA